jgi:hypothetical protein
MKYMADPAISEAFQKQGLNDTLANLNRDQQSSNIAGAGNPDGFTHTASLDEQLGDEGFQIVRPEAGDPKPEKLPPEGSGDSIDPAWVGEEKDHFQGANTVDKNSNPQREDLDNLDYMDETADVSETVNWDSLKDRAEKAGLKIEDYLDPQDLNGPEASILARVLLNEIEVAEMSRFYGDALQEVALERGKEYSAELRPDRIGTPGIRTAIEKNIERDPQFLTEIWTKAGSIDITIDKNGGPTMISIRTPNIRSKPGSSKFIHMSIEDFSNMFSLPDQNDGKSKLVFPEVNSDSTANDFRVASFFERVSVDGSYIGGEEIPDVRIQTRNSKAEDTYKYRPEVNRDPKLWHPATEDTA